MTDLKIRKIWEHSCQEFLDSGHHLSDTQAKASYAILNCKSGKLGINISQCPDCGYLDFITIPVATATVRTARQSIKKSG